MFLYLGTICYAFICIQALLQCAIAAFSQRTVVLYLLFFSDYFSGPPSFSSSSHPLPFSLSLTEVLSEASHISKLARASK